VSENLLYKWVKPESLQKVTSKKIPQNVWQEHYNENHQIWHLRHLIFVGYQRESLKHSFSKIKNVSTEKLFRRKFLSSLFWNSLFSRIWSFL